MKHTISEFFISIDSPTGTIVIWSIIGFVLCWLTVLLLGIITAKLIEDKDHTYRQETYEEFASIGNTIFFLGSFYSLVLYLWHCDILVTASHIAMWVITIMAAINLILYILIGIIAGVEWLLKGVKYYRHNPLSIKDAIYIILQCLANIIGSGIFIVFTCIVVFS